MLLGRDFSSRRAAVNIFAKHLYIKLLYINNNLSVISLEKNGLCTGKYRRHTVAMTTIFHFPE